MKADKKTRLLSLETCRSQIDGADFLQLHFHGRIINQLDRYVFVVQFWCKDSQKEIEKVIGVKSVLPRIAVNSESVFHAIVDEACDGNVKKVYSVMSDTTSMNTEKKTGINKRLWDYVSENYQHDAHCTWFSRMYV